MSSSRLRILALAGICLLAQACQGPLTPSVPLQTLLDAPLVVEIDGRQYTLETYLWRDFMPPTEPNGSPLAAVVYVTAVDGQPFPAEVGADRLWVVNGEEVWETAFSGEQRPRDQAHLYQLEKFTAGGPKWDVGIQVEVVVRVKSATGRIQLLRATKQLIGQTV